LNHLTTQFKKSSRVHRLSGLYLEKKGRFEDAHAVYTQLLNEDPTNTLARKRMIAMLKAQRKITEAIDGLRQYLNT
uniref:ER membrane protein complex subunit 2 n=1 Tax=Echinostoma caproni TaxID=27848 RepID=A0A183B5D0_9TREM